MKALYNQEIQIKNSPILIGELGIDYMILWISLLMSLGLVVGA